MTMIYLNKNRHKYLYFTSSWSIILYGKYIAKCILYSYYMSLHIAGSFIFLQLNKMFLILFNH